MRIALAHGNCCTSRNVQSCVANDHVQRTLQDKEMLILVLVNVHRHTVARISHDLKHGIDTLRLLDRGSDLETLARCCFQPFPLVLMIDRQNFGRLLRRCHIDLPVSKNSGVTAKVGVAP
jgi:precorrin-6x reductase